MSDWAKFAVVGALVTLLGAWGIHGPGLAGSSSTQIEQRLFTQVARALGYLPDTQWAVFDVDGQSVMISGSAPSENHKLLAEEAARRAVWRGGLVVGGVTRVASTDARVWAEREGPYVWRADVDLNRVELSGAAPSREIADDLAVLAGALFADRRVVDAQIVDPAPPDDGWEPAARGALAVLSHFELGEAVLVDFALTVEGDVESGAELRAAQTSLDRLDRLVSVFSRVDARVLRPPAEVAPASTTRVQRPSASEPDPNPAEEPIEEQAETAIEESAEEPIEELASIASAEPSDAQTQPEIPVADCQARFDAQLADARVQFATGSAAVSADSVALIEAIAAIATECAPFSLRIEGYTDDTGSSALNQTLSERRAEAVVERLAAAGVDRQRLSAVGFGASRPVAGNDTEQGRRLNRRIEIVVAP